jgi:hypothetical protein
MLRAVPYTSLWGGVILWALLTGGLFTGTAWKLRQDYLFLHQSCEAAATIDNKFLRVGYGKGGKHYTPCLDYHYPADEMVIHCESTAKPGTYDLIRIGQEMPIRYLLNDPSDNQIEEPAEIRDTTLVTRGAITVSLLAFFGGLGLTLYHAQRNRLHQFLLANGQSCHGIIETIDYDIIGKSQTPMYFLTFEFFDLNGRKHSGKTWHLQPGDETRWREGRPIRVYYDPNNSERFTVDLNTGREDR